MLNKLSKAQAVKVKSVEREGGLIDGCNYMVYLNEGYEHDVFGDSFPIHNLAELKRELKEVESGYQVY